jgi:hypothetical protein
MSLDLFGGAMIIGILVVALYIWTIMRLWSKWDTLTDVWKVLYALMFLIPGIGPIPILILLVLNVGVDKSETDDTQETGLY